LAITAIVAYWFINKRRKSQPTEESEHIELTFDERISEAVAEARPVLVGVISTKSYYPVDTPLDQLVSPEEQESNIVYFNSEEDAKELGFSPAPAVR
jgi:hypothetical protein